ncbi:unnamed protein product [Hymenolepis diminuta]|uniref:Secreted protein n=1 Tax=Hymenolepis diminuta TaxID=6216 RepID=A0A564Z669_HYMDI|nr:unnamed protein product [Hymenolepis diminuta]
MHLLLLCPLIAFVPYLSPTRLNPPCGLISTYWPKQLLVFWSRIGVSCQSVVVVVILTPNNVKPPFYLTD